MSTVSIAVMLPADGYVIEISAAAPERLTLGHETVFRLPAGCRGIRVVSGTAWITWNGQDVILPAGEMHTFDGTRSDRIVSAGSRQPLTLELLR